ncbi:hypothetical protein Agub_g4388 [Astrephomene gubernaculifera]|uniref:Uncharacterized protein n=1 Tax=Astrephomene gubernaculifera TaxID=47775 RepID=A0AAD3DK21_9CHLO|nr:hypothetical protein Agub_g4388 [Astrephomene gubernaculifera]
MRAACGLHADCQRLSFGGRILRPLCAAPAAVHPGNKQPLLATSQEQLQRSLDLGPAVKQAPDFEYVAVAFRSQQRPKRSNVQRRPPRKDAPEGSGACRKIFGEDTGSGYRTLEMVSGDKRLLFEDKNMSSEPQGNTGAATDAASPSDAAEKESRPQPARGSGSNSADVGPSKARRHTANPGCHSAVPQRAIQNAHAARPPQPPQQRQRSSSSGDRAASPTAVAPTPPTVATVTAVTKTASKPVSPPRPRPPAAPPAAAPEAQAGPRPPTGPQPLRPPPARPVPVPAPSAAPVSPALATSSVALPRTASAAAAAPSPRPAATSQSPRHPNYQLRIRVSQPAARHSSLHRRDGRSQPPAAPTDSATSPAGHQPPHSNPGSSPSPSSRHGSQQRIVHWCSRRGLYVEAAASVLLHMSRYELRSHRALYAELRALQPSPEEALPHLAAVLAGDLGLTPLQLRAVLVGQPLVLRVPPLKLAARGAALAAALGLPPPSGPGVGDGDCDGGEGGEEGGGGQLAAIIAAAPDVLTCRNGYDATCGALTSALRMPPGHARALLLREPRLLCRPPGLFHQSLRQLQQQLGLPPPAAAAMAVSEPLLLVVSPGVLRANGVMLRKQLQLTPPQLAAVVSHLPELLARPHGVLREVVWRLTACLMHSKVWQGHISKLLDSPRNVAVALSFGSDRYERLEYLLKTGRDGVMGFKDALSMEVEEFGEVFPEYDGWRRAGGR